MRINIFEEDHDELVGEDSSASTPPILDLIVAVAESLPRANLDLLRRRLTAIGT